MSQKITRLSLLVLLTIPSISFGALSGVNDLLTAVSGIVKSAIPLVFGCAILFFLYGVAKFVRAAGNEKELENGKRLMIWGVIAIFVMTSVLGIIQIIGSNLGISTGITNVPATGLSPNGSSSNGSPSDFNANDIPTGNNNG